MISLVLATFTYQRWLFYLVYVKKSTIFLGIELFLDKISTFSK